MKCPVTFKQATSPTGLSTTVTALLLTNEHLKSTGGAFKLQESSSGVLPQYEPNSTHCMNQHDGVVFFDLAAKMADMHINHVVQGRRTIGLPPDILGQHFARQHFVRAGAIDKHA